MKYRFLRFPGGRKKALTLSYDDAQIQDKHLVEIMNSYGIKGTFNLNGNIVDNCKNPGALTELDLKTIYFPNGHEVAVHGEKHMALIKSSAIDGIGEVLNGRKILEKFYGRIIRGMAYPDLSENNEEIQGYLKMLGIVYSRTAKIGEGSFALPKNWYDWTPTAKHKNPRLFEFADAFLEKDPDMQYVSSRDPLLFYLWGHSFELDHDDGWNIMEKFCSKMGKREDIWYATNIDIYDYVTAYKALVFSADNSVVYNPSIMDVWFYTPEKMYCIKSGETMNL